MCLQIHLSLPALNKSPNLVKVAGSPGTCGIIRELFPYREVFDSHVGGYFALTSGINKDKLILPPAGKGTRGKVGRQKTELESLASYHNIETWSLCRPIWETSMKFLLQNSPIRCSVNWISIHHICHLNLHFSRWESDDRSQMPWFSHESYPFGEREVNEYSETSRCDIFAESVELGQDEAGLLTSMAHSCSVSSSLLGSLVQSEPWRLHCTVCTSFVGFIKIMICVCLPPREVRVSKG